MRIGRNPTLTALLVAATLFLALNLASRSTLSRVRLDLTDNRLHTLSRGTENILKNLPVPIELQLFWTPDAGNEIPPLKLYAERVTELLGAYASLSEGKLTVRTVDPVPFSEEEDRAVELGLQQIPLGSRGERFTLGLAGAAGDARQVIPFLDPEREPFLEYDLTQLVWAIAHPKKPAVGLISSLPLASGRGGDQFDMPRPWIAVDQLERTFNLRRLGQDLTAVPADLDALLVVQPQGLPEAAIYAIDQYALRGGKLLVLTDPYAESGRGMASDQGGERFGALLKSWGARMDTSQVAGDPARALRVNFSFGAAFQVAPYPPWFQVSPEQLARKEVITAQLGRIIMASPGALSPVEGARTTFVPLVSTGPKGGLIARDKLEMPPNPNEILAAFASAGSTLTLAARLTGPAATAFPGGPPAGFPQPKEGDAAPPPHAESSDGDIQVVVIADTDFLDDRFWVEVNDLFGRPIAVPSAANGDLLLNALDHLAGSADLISVRSRDVTARPFTLLERIGGEAEARYRAKEQELRKRLEETERKLSELQEKRPDASSPQLTPEQQKALEEYRQEKVRIRRDLRDVRYQLRRDIEGLERRIVAINTALVPLLVVVGAVVILTRRRHRKRVWEQAAAAPPAAS